MPETSSLPRTVPLAEYPGLEHVVPEYVPPLGIDTRRLGVMAALSCIEEFSFKTERGESTSYDTKIVGHSGGVAFGGASGVRKASRASSELQDRSDGIEERLFSACHPMVPATITIGTEALKEAVGAQARNPHEWAKHLNKAIGDGVNEAATQHLLKGAGGLEALMAAMGASTGFWSFATEQAKVTPLEAYAGSVSALMVIGLPGLLMGRRRLSRYCFSAVPVAHVDRLMAVKALTRLRPAVRPLKTS